MGDGRHDRQQAQRRVQAAFLKAVPAERTGNRIGPEAEVAADPARQWAQLVAPVHPARQMVEQQKHGDRGGQRQQQPFRRQVARRVKHRKNDQAGGIVGNGQQQQKAHRRVPGPEHHTPHEIGKGDVGSGRNGPAARHRVEHVGSEKQRQAKVNRDRAEHATGGGHQRRRRLAPPERAVLQDHGFPDFLGRDGEKERHQHIVDQIMQAQHLRDVAIFEMSRPLAIGLGPIVDVGADQVVEQQRIFGEMVIGMRIDVCPDQRDQRAGDQQQRIVGHEIPDAIHARRLPPRFTNSEVN